MTTERNMRDFVMTDDQLERIMLATFEQSGMQPHVARQVVAKSFPMTGAALLHVLNFRGVHAKPSDLVAFIEDPNNVVEMRNGLAYFHVGDMRALFEKLFAEGRFTDAALERAAEGITVEQGIAQLEIEFTNELNARALHVCRN